MKKIRHDILDLIESDFLSAEYLNEWGLRTNLFLGSWPKGYSSAAYSRLGENENTKRCLIAQLFDRWYGADTAKQNSELLHFECLRYDCMFYSEKQYGPDKYPESWNYDWLIEVENDFGREFVMTMMGLLDVVCNHRLAIFFTDEQVNDDMTERFRRGWQTHVSRHAFVKDFDLCALLLPAAFDKGAMETYKNKALLIRWDAAAQQFVEVGDE